ncbi:MAG: hypothetical protein WC365_00735 [Candidatus Babeliales bacterium]
MESASVIVIFNDPGEEQKIYEKFLLVALEENNLKTVISCMSPMELSFCIARIQAQLIKILNETKL